MLEHVAAFIISAHDTCLTCSTSARPSPKVSHHAHRAFTTHARTELFDYCVKEGIADKSLIDKWRKVSKSANITDQFALTTTAARI